MALSRPTGDDRRFAGSPSWTLTPAVVVGRTAGRWTFAGQLGMTFRERNAIAAVEVNDEVLLTAGVGYAVHPRVDLLLDSALRVTVNPSSGRDPEAPFGAWIGAAWRPATWPALSATAGAGITSDVGMARPEVMLGARFTAERANPCTHGPEDYDGFEDRDFCADPDNDRDGIPDGRDSDTIRNVSLTVLDEVANTIRRNPDILRMRVEGYTDDRGTPEYNLDLSYRRSRSLVEYLVARGVEPARLDFAGYGRGHSVADNGSPDGHSLNRRVEFTIVGQSSAAPVADSSDVPTVEAPRRHRHRHRR